MLTRNVCLSLSCDERSLNCNNDIWVDWLTLHDFIVPYPGACCVRSALCHGIDSTVATDLHQAQHQSERMSGDAHPPCIVRGLHHTERNIQQ
jgi:hypothetical protein